MAKRKKLSDQEVQAQVRSELLACDTANGSLLAGERSENMDYYQGKPFGNEQKGRSAVVSTDVRDAIEWIKPTLLRIFASGEDVVEFEPETVGDEAAAKLATEYVNFIWHRDNEGFKNFYEWFTDALMQKVGIVKIWWDDTKKTKRERYSGLDDTAFASLVNDDEVEVAEHTERQDEIDIPQVDPLDGTTTFTKKKETVHDLVITRTTADGCVKVMCVAPEEFMISRTARDIETARCVAHKRLRLTNDLIEEGYDPGVVNRLSGDELTVTTNIEEVSRNTVEQIGVGQDTPPTSQNREVWVYEAYMKLDEDGDGIAEMRKVTLAGNTYEILDDESWDMPRPFATLTPTPMPHRFWGISVADMLKDIQLIKSTLLRQLLDNMYLQNNQREEVLESAIVDPQELLTSVPGQKIRVRAMNSIQPIVVPPIGEAALQAITYIDQTAEDRTGVSNKTQGLAADALHETASGEKMLMSAAMGKIELIARVFAETGVRDAFRMILKLVCAYQNKERMIRLSQKWVPIDPSGWNEDMNMTVSVATGTGDKDIKLQNASVLAAMQEKAFPLGLVTPQNMFETAELAVQAMGLKSAQKFFTLPDPNAPPKPPPPDPKMIEVQGKLQLQQQDQQFQQQKAQAELAANQQEAAQKAQIAQMEAQYKAATDQHLNQLEAQRRQLELQQEGQIDQMKLEMTERLELAKARITQETAIITARITAKATGGQIEEAEAAARDDEMLGPARQSDVKAVMEKLDNLTNTTQQVSQTVSKPPPDPNAQPPHPAVVGALQALAHIHAQGQTMAGEQHRQAMDAHGKVLDALNSEKELVRDPKTGKPTGVRVKPKAPA